MDLKTRENYSLLKQKRHAPLGLSFVYSEKEKGRNVWNLKHVFNEHSVMVYILYFT